MMIAQQIRKFEMLRARPAVPGRLRDDAVRRECGAGPEGARRARGGDGVNETAMAEAARAYQQVFVENGRPENFVDALLAAAAAVRAGQEHRE
ncbi:MAG TPA: hypothetical protein VGH98_21420 [Gemmatimonadaceae bacterium]|jgi:hypothetical protein